MSDFHPLRTFEGSFIGAAMKSLLRVLGIAAVLMGLLWVGQGTGLVHWPASSFMIDQRPWVVRGAILTVIGMIMVAASRKGGSRHR